MRKGHRRTQSSYLTSVSQPTETSKNQPPKPQPQTHEIFTLLKASEDKISTKIVNFEKLDLQKQYIKDSSRQTTNSCQMVKGWRKPTTERRDNRLSMVDELSNEGVGHRLQKQSQMKGEGERKFKKKEQKTIYFYKNSKIQQEYQTEDESKKLRNGKIRFRF